MPKPKKKKLGPLAKFFTLFFQPVLPTQPAGFNTRLKTVKYNIPSSNLAAKIIESWFPRGDAKLIEGAPAPVCGRLTKHLNQNTGVEYVALEVFYDLVPSSSFFTVLFNVRLTGTLFCNLRQDLLLRQTEIEFEWAGPEHPLSDLWDWSNAFRRYLERSLEYKVVHYLIERTNNEFLCSGYTEITKAVALQVAEKRTKSLSGRQAKQWWRTYNAGEGEKIYSFWPNPQDYAEAVQNPLPNFKDEGLQKCSVAVNHLGIPRVNSGMFASVYQLTSEVEQWAVRCFDTRLIDQQERYKAISSFILSDDLTYTVDFHYLEDGINCGGIWFPILKMTWVEGQSLDAYVRDNYRDYSALQKLRWEFQIMMEKLRLNGVAHGDLQHGNILVNDGEIFLVDYDGFYVPELAGRHSNELGHANYQHPTRTEKHFAPYIDNFSALVIDLSLLCLMEDPSLWQEFDCGDECLLFRKADYLHPLSSKLIAALMNHESERIRNGVQKLLAYLQMPLEDLPYLESDMPASLHIDELEPQLQK